MSHQQFAPKSVATLHKSCGKERISDSIGSTYPGVDVSKLFMIIRISLDSKREWKKAAMNH